MQEKQIFLNVRIYKNNQVQCHTKLMIFRCS